MARLTREQIRERLPEIETAGEGMEYGEIVISVHQGEVEKVHRRDAMTTYQRPKGRPIKQN
jgi:hypothetical protein